MREILFRGQTRKAGERVDAGGKPLPGKWVYGGVYMSPDCNHAIIYNEDGKFPVHADTVGQFTGLTNFDRTRIFEGDIVDFTVFDCLCRDTQYRGYITFGMGDFLICKSLSDPYFDGDGPFDLGWTSDQDPEIAVVGNIHDNPELLE